MSRSGYSDDYDDDRMLYLWRGTVARAINGKRGQKFLREMRDALDAMPNKRLIDGDLISDGEVCAIGSVGVAKGVPMDDLDPENPEEIAARFGISAALVQEIEYMNDEYPWISESPEARWSRMRAWVSKQIKEPQS
ncbi:hypothetical protein [Acidiphilium sp.]|uniref:hypothetical protein n=1 Tax=Acidiphilium sp. TaxID=527 RepID=UPI002C623DF9|nr:hypothetical protein [Acidiphilium sp.]HQT62796.1 hypothetical protein [Acidiphilium sp.]